MTLLKSHFENMQENTIISEESIHKIKKFPCVVIWGTAGAANYAYEFLTSLGIHINYVTDSFSHHKDEVWHGIPILNKESVFAMGDKVIIVIACSFGYQIDKLLASKSINYVMFDTNLLNTNVDTGSSQYIGAKGEIVKAFDQIFQVYSLLGDDKSRITLYNALCYRITLDRDLLLGVYDKNTYFGNDVVPSISCDAIVDCGAFIGDSMESFFRHGCSCKKYFALEPSPKQYEILKDCIARNHFQNVEALPLAAWDCREKLTFVQTSGGASHIGKTGELTIQADTIDSITSGQKVDCIKMDIEGSEIPALNGAKHAIQTYHPVVMASIYHHLSDMWEIPILLKDLYPDYRLYIRHHSPWGDDTVLYALPV